MTKKEAYELISDYLDGNMSENELRDFELIIDGDSVLKKEIKDIKNLIQDMKKIDPLRLPNDFDDKLKDAIDKANPYERFSLLKIFNKPLLNSVGSLAAAILLVVTVTIFFSESQKNNIMIDSSEIAFEEDVTIKDDDIEIHQAKSKKADKLK
jgi:predicted transcriptional regulator